VRESQHSLAADGGGFRGRRGNAISQERRGESPHRPEFQTAAARHRQSVVSQLSHSNGLSLQQEKMAAPIYPILTKTIDLATSLITDGGDRKIVQFRRSSFCGAENAQTWRQLENEFAMMERRQARFELAETPDAATWLSRLSPVRLISIGAGVSVRRSHFPGSSPCEH
jgi:hypothetical protein